MTFRIAREILGMDTIEDTKSKIGNVFPNRHHTITAPDFRISNWACREPTAQHDPLLGSSG